MAKVRTPPPEPPARDFEKEQAAINQILDALAPFHPDVQSTLLRTIVVFKNIYIPQS